MSESLEQFLSRIKLEEYLPNFIANNITGYGNLTEDILLQIGIDKIGHRRRLLTEMESAPLVAGNLIDLDEDVQDLPPPLPPKSSAPQTVARPVPPKRISSVKTKPQKPPRLNINKSPAVNDYKLLNFADNKPSISPPQIPNRYDLAIDFPPPPPISPTICPSIPARPSPTELAPVSPISPGDPSPVVPERPSRKLQKSRAGSACEKVEIVEDPPNDLDTSDELLRDRFESYDSDRDDPSSVIPVDEEPAVEQQTLSLLRQPDKFRSCIDANRRKDMRKSRIIQRKSGWLSKKGGQHADKFARPRWVEFDGIYLTYAKDKESDPKQSIPVNRMEDVEYEKSAKKPTFHLVTPNRRFTFIEPNGDFDELCKWMSRLQEAIDFKASLDDDDNVGGKMSNPDKEGWLLKQGRDIIKGFNERYVAIKEDNFCYYYNFEDFHDDLPINCLKMQLASLKEDHSKLCLNLHYHTQKVYTFKTNEESSYLSWKTAIETAIQVGLGDCEILQLLQESPSNNYCADCGCKNPIWASVNLFVVVCIQCIGAHRSLGAKISKARSATMDKKVWSPPLVKLFQVMGNKNANSLWSGKMPSDDKIASDVDFERRTEFVREKYSAKRFFSWSEMYGQPEQLGMALRKNVVTDNVLETLKLIVSGADVYYVPEGSEDARTPYELAEDAGLELQMELLRQYQGHLTIEERQALALSLAETSQKEFDQAARKSSCYDKTGLLQTRLSRNEPWKEKVFMLKGKRLWYHKGPKTDDIEAIDLTKLEDLEYCESEYSLTLTVNKRHYFLKGYIPEDGESWLEAIKNKQVMKVNLELQELSGEKIPFLVEKCITYIEAHGLTLEGIYRRNGSQTQIKKLILLFNQDAANVRLTTDECPDVHAVAGLLKQYLRELPQPLLTHQLAGEFRANSHEVADCDHEAKLYRYRDLLDNLPDVNYNTLRSLIIHLSQVTAECGSNQMTISNIMLIYGPIFASGGNSLDQDVLNQEYNVLADLLTYYKWLFGVDENEIKKIDSTKRALKKLAEAQEAANQIKTQEGPVQFDSMQVTIHVANLEDQMKMTSNTRPKDVCLFCINKHNLSIDGNWALFESNKDNTSERPVHSRESVLSLALHVGDRLLTVKENYIVAKISPFQTTSLGLQGYLHYSKNDRSWKKNYYIEVKTGNIRIYSKKGSSKEEEQLAIHELLLYVGLEPKKKSPGKFGFSIVRENERSEVRYFSTDKEVERDMFIAAILSIKYPTGLWTPLNSVEETSNEPVVPLTTENYWGRQSMYLRPRGASVRMREQLQIKKNALKNVLHIS